MRKYRWRRNRLTLGAHDALSATYRVRRCPCPNQPDAITLTRHPSRDWLSVRVVRGAMIRRAALAAPGMTWPLKPHQVRAVLRTCHL